MAPLTLPPPPTLIQRIEDCEIELRSLRQLLRISSRLGEAEEAKLRRLATALVNERQTSHAG